MEQDTVVQDENAANSENHAEEEVVDQQQLEQEQEADQGKQEELPVEQPSRSERREQNYIDRLSDQIRNSGNSTSHNRTDEYKPLQYEEGSEYDPAQLEEDRNAFGKSQFNQGIQTAQSYVEPLKLNMWADRLEFDADRVNQDWPILDESNEKEFDKDFANEINQKYLNFIGYKQGKDGKVTIERPDIRYRDFVRAERQNIERYASRLNANSTRNIVKQAANTGIRPGGQSRTTKGHNIDTSDPNWPSKLSQKEYQEWGKDLLDEQINEALGIKK